jgi:hypothetical protein
VSHRAATDWVFLALETRCHVLPLLVQAQYFRIVPPSLPRRALPSLELLEKRDLLTAHRSGHRLARARIPRWRSIPPGSGTSRPARQEVGTSISVKPAPQALSPFIPPAGTSRSDLGMGSSPSFARLHCSSTKSTGRKVEWTTYWLHYFIDFFRTRFIIDQLTEFVRLQRLGVGVCSRLPSHRKPANISQCY